jgi:hypothetical protein
LILSRSFQGLFKEFFLLEENSRSFQGLFKEFFLLEENSRSFQGVILYLLSLSFENPSSLF